MILSQQILKTMSDFGYLSVLLFFTVDQYHGLLNLAKRPRHHGKP